MQLLQGVFLTQLSSSMWALYTGFIVLMHFFMLAFSITYEVLDKQFEDQTLGPDQEYYMWVESVFDWHLFHLIFAQRVCCQVLLWTRNNLMTWEMRAYCKWSSDALTKIATNMNNQHKSIRQHLQVMYFWWGNGIYLSPIIQLQKHWWLLLRWTTTILQPQPPLPWY